jgi:hypothetical protein
MSKKKQPLRFAGLGGYFFLLQTRRIKPIKLTIKSQNKNRSSKETMRSPPFSFGIRGLTEMRPLCQRATAYRYWQYHPENSIVFAIFQQ